MALGSLLTWRIDEAGSGRALSNLGRTKSGWSCSVKKTWDRLDPASGLGPIHGHSLSLVVLGQVRSNYNGSDLIGFKSNSYHEIYDVNVFLKN